MPTHDLNYPLDEGAVNAALQSLLDFLPFVQKAKETNIPDIDQTIAALEETFKQLDQLKNTWSRPPNGHV